MNAIVPNGPQKTGANSPRVSGAKASVLAFDRGAGRLVGSIGGRSLDLEIVNMEIGEFLQYFFIVL